MLTPLRLALRQLRQARGFTAIVVLTLALGVGANIALFSVVNAVLLEPLPYPAPRQLTAVYNTSPGVQRGSSSYPNFQDWQRRAALFASLAMYRHQDYTLSGAEGSELVTGLMVSADFFRTLRVAPMLGRDLTAADDHLGSGPVVVISYGFWARRFGASPLALGQALDLDGVSYTIIGVLPAGFEFYGQRQDVFTAIGRWDDPDFRDRSTEMSAYVVGRLQPGVSLAAAQADMRSIARVLAAAYPAADHGMSVSLVPLRDDLVGSVQPYLLLLAGAVGFLLLIACVNIANLMLARSQRRAREFAVRAALGASAARLLRQTLIESSLLAAAGGGLGLLLAIAAQRLTLAVLPASLPRAAAVAVDARVLIFTVAVSALTGVLFGIAPALAAARSQALGALRAGAQIGGRRGPQAVLASLEIALALVLLIGAGLMLRTLAALQQVNPGYDPQHALIFNLALPADPGTTPAQTRSRLRAFDAAIARIPGVEAESATLGSRPLLHESSIPVWVAGRPQPARQNDLPQALLYLAGGGYARAMGLHLERGRFLTDDDNENAPTVIVIDSVFARTQFPGQNPVGRSVRLVPFHRDATVVGVVDHVKQWGLQDEPPNAIESEFFYPMAQLPASLMSLVSGGTAVVVRVYGDPTALIPQMRQAVHRLDPREYLYQVQTLSGVLSDSLAARRSTLGLLMAFGAMALALAAVGIYGVLSCWVEWRRREIGIRVALGGNRRRVLNLVLADALRIALAGVGAGLVAAWLLTRTIHGMLYRVPATDPVTYAAVAALLVVAALLAAYVPARRALRVDPLTALRAE